MPRNSTKLSTKKAACMWCGKIFVRENPRRLYCSKLCKNRKDHSVRRKKGTENITDEQYSTISGNWEHYLKRLVNRKHRKETLTTEDLLRILETQEGKCALTGIKMTCQLERGTIFLTNASIDRITAGGPYTPENVQLVCSVVNQWRGALPAEQFILWCRKVTENSIPKANALQQKLQTRLQHRVQKAGCDSKSKKATSKKQPSTKRCDCGRSCKKGKHSRCCPHKTRSKR